MRGEKEQYGEIWRDMGRYGQRDDLLDPTLAEGGPLAGLAGHLVLALLRRGRRLLHGQREHARARCAVVVHAEAHRARHLPRGGRGR